MRIAGRARGRLLPDRRHARARRELLDQVRAFADEKVAPIINQYWGRAEFPFELIRHYGALGIAGAGYSGYGCRGRSTLLDAWSACEVDASWALLVSSA